MPSIKESSNFCSATCRRTPPRRRGSDRNLRPRHRSYRSMDESNQGAAKRGAILAAVLIAHAAVFAALLMTSRTGARPAPQANAVELVFLAPANPPKVRGAAASPRRSSGEVALVIAPPVPDSPSLPLAASTSSSYGGDGSGVDWAAEARRALQAFEIRRNQFSAGKSVSGRPEDENWLPNVQHRAG